MKDVFKTLKETGSILKEQQKGITADDIDKVREDMEDLKSDLEEGFSRLRSALS